MHLVHYQYHSTVCGKNYVRVRRAAESPGLNAVSRCVINHYFQIK